MVVFTEEHKFDHKALEKEDKKNVLELIDSAFLFSVIWSVCITIHGDNRKDFSDYLKGIYEGRIIGIEKFTGGKKMPEVFLRGTIYDYVFYSDTQQWKHWQ